MDKAEENQLRLDVASITERTIAENVQALIRLTRYRLSLKDPSPHRVRSRHEAYGIVAENYANVAASLKLVKKDAETLLGTLGDINRPALKAVNSLCDTSFNTAVAALIMVAEMRRTLSDLNAAENQEAHYPMDDLLSMGTSDSVEAEVNE